jgi:cation transport regulator ChaB
MVSGAHSIWSAVRKLYEFNNLRLWQASWI